MRRKAEITVFISFVLVIMSGLVGAVIESARIVSSKEQAKMILKNALNSSMSEYNKELFERYGLILVDTTYKGKESGEECFEQHLFDYVNENLKNDDNAQVCRVTIKNIDLLETISADSCEYQPLLEQIVQYESSLIYMHDENTALDSYILASDMMSYEDLYARMSDYSVTDKLIFIKNYIEEEMNRNSENNFCFENCLVHAKVKAVFETESGYNFCVFDEK